MPLQGPWNFQQVPGIPEIPWDFLKASETFRRFQQPNRFVLKLTGSFSNFQKAPVHGKSLASRSLPCSGVSRNFQKVPVHSKSRASYTFLCPESFRNFQQVPEGPRVMTAAHRHRCPLKPSETFWNLLKYPESFSRPTGSPWNLLNIPGTFRKFQQVPRNTAKT